MTAVTMTDVYRARRALAPHLAPTPLLRSFALSEQFGTHRYVGDIRGRGLFLALELVRDRRTKEPFDAELKLAERIRVRAMENGLVCYPMGGVVDGKRGENVMIAPPFIIEERHVFELVDKLNRTLDDVLG